MNKKEILIICFSICVLLSLQTAFASDINGTDNVLTTHNDDVVQLNSNVSAYSLPNSNNMLQDGSEGADSFSDLQYKLNSGNEIILTNNYSFDSTSDSGLANGIAISKDLKIIGNGNIVIDAKNQARVFNIASGNKVSLTGITFINGHVSGNGGVINSAGTLTIDNCTFINNTADGDGGAVFVSGTSSTVLNSVFENNVAKRNGGAIYWSGEYGNINNTNFTNNRATGEKLEYDMSFDMSSDVVKVTDKSEIPLLDSSVGKLFVVNQTHSGNIAHFESYVVEKNGNDVYELVKLDETDIVISESIISPVDWAIDQFFGGDGGTILWSGDYGLIYNCSFIDSNSARRGGGAYMTGSDNVTYDLCYFENCTSGTNGGGVDWLAGATYGKIFNSVFNNTRAARSAGAIYYDGWYGELANLTFINTTSYGGSLKTSRNGEVNYAGWDSSHWDTNTTGGDAGSIMFTGSHINVYNATFVNCTSSGRGGAVFLQDNTNVTFDLCTFENNIALGIANNTYNDDKNISSGRNILHTGNGGAIAFDMGASYGTIKNSKFVNNTAARDGGAIDFAAGSSYSTIYNSTFDNNAAYRSGGAFYWDGTHGNITYSNFTNNRATGTALQFGEGISYENIVVVNKTMPIADVSTMNKLYILDNSTSKTDIRYKSYVTVKNGDEYEWLLLDETHIVNDDAPSPTDWGMDEFFGGDGGTILWGGDNGIIDHCIFIDSNSARRGGGAYMRGSDNVTFSNSEFINCTSGTNGGALDWLAGANYGKVINSTFTGNRAARSAGTIYYDGNYGEFINITVRDSYAYGGSLKTSRNEDVTYAGWDSSHWDTNTTGGDAGAIMITGDHVYIYNATFVNCTATGRGGAVFLQDNYNVTFDLCKFANNTALGTANNTYNDDTDVSSGLNILHTGFGGAVAFDRGASYGTIKNSMFVNNTAARDGGAIDFAPGSSYSVIFNSTFENNTAYRSGGAFYWDGSNGNVSYCNFTNNRALGTALQYDMELSYENIVVVYKTMPQASEETMNKLYILDNSTSISNIIYKAYVTVKNGNEFSWLLLNEINIVNDDAPSPTDWGMDEFFGGDGGTILWGGDNGIIDHCIFVDSNSARRGGGAYMKGSDNITFSNSEFINCTSGTNGGALDWLAGANYGKVINSTFTGNRAARSAGTLYYDGNYGEFINITVRDSMSYGGSLDKSSDGLVVYAGWDSSHWDTNTTGGDAGAIMITGDHVYLYNATFINCTATGRGGAVFLQDNTNVTFDLCKFENNTALGIANNTWNNYTSEHDESDNDTKINYKLTGHGGAIGFDVNSKDGVIKNSEFINNYARRDGGAINYATGSLNGTIKDTKFINNSAGDDGGAINWEGNVGLIKNITCYNNTGVAFADPVTGNSTSKGGTICLTGNNVNITDSSFTLGVVFHNGGKLNETDAGAIFVTGNRSKISNTIFDRCYSPNQAGAIEVIGNHTVIDNCTFKNCNATKNGGALYVSGIDCNLSDSNFTNNTAGGDGGSVYIIGSNSRISTSNFTASIAYEDGGALYWQGEYGKVISCLFRNNEALSYKNSTYERVYSNANSGLNEVEYDILGGDGGAVIWLGSHGLIEDSTFKNNTAAYRGGAIFIQRVSSDVTCNNTTIKDCTFELNDAGTNGGAINWATGAYNCTLTGSTLNNNTANRSGGAIYVNGAYISVIDSQFDLNNVLGIVQYDDRITGPNYSTLGGNGGAVIWIGSYGLVDNGTFTRNTAATEGGALYAQGASGSNCTNMVIKNSVFDENDAAFDGGAISFSLGAQNATVSNTSFNRNTAPSGGAIYVKGDDTNISTSTFEGNRAQTYGGAIYINGLDTDILDSNFTNCSLSDANSKGSAIYINGANTIINGSDFKNCSIDASGAQGGAIYIEGVNATIDDSTFENCKVNQITGLGGAIYIKGNNATISQSMFNDSSAYRGGFIYLEGSWCNVSSSSFSNSHVSWDGGAMYSTGSYSGVYNSNFTNNVAGYDGGALFWYGGKTSATSSKNNTIDGCIFINNTAYAPGGTITVDDNTRTTRGGGAVYWSEYGSYSSITNSLFINNSAQTNNKADGGAVLLDAAYHGIIDNCIFDGNYITTTKTDVDWVQGGALFLRAHENFTISNCEFKNSSSYSEAGAIYLSNKDGTNNIGVLLVNVTFTNNHAENKGTHVNGGGAIQIKECYNNVILRNVTFINNTANNGGAVSIFELYNNAKVMFYDCNFTDNEATYNGGSFWTNRLFYIYNSTIANSNATNYGGGLYSSVQFCADNLTFINNTAKLAGGLYINKENVLIQNMTFISNHASNNGGGLYIPKENATIQYVTFINNIADNNGGGLYSSVKFYADDLTFINNTAKSGGGLYSTAQFYNTNLTFINNSATGNGGGLVLAKSDAFIENMTFINNTAAGDGGAIYIAWGWSNTRVYNVNMTGNIANQGGAIYIAGENTIISDVNMTGNKAGIGSAIYVYWRQATLINCYLIENQANSTEIKFDSKNFATGEFNISFRGTDKYMNAVYVTGSYKLNCTNVTYWDAEGITNTGETSVIFPLSGIKYDDKNTLEAGQNITVTVYDANGNILNQKSSLTGTDGKIRLDLYRDLGIDQSVKDDIYVEAEVAEDYYTYIKTTTRDVSNITASINKTKYRQNSTVHVNVTAGATGNVSIYFNDTFLGNITLDASEGSINISTLIDGVYLPIGINTLTAVYNGNAKYDVSSIDFELEITKTDSITYINATDLGNNILINVTVVNADIDSVGNTGDLTGNVTITLDDRTIIIPLVNGTGTGFIYNVPQGEVRVNATYSGDDTYYGSKNHTFVEITEKIRTYIDLEVNAEDIMVNETIQINITVISLDSSIVEGNLTIILDNVKYNLTLNNSKASFNKTGLSAGHKIVTVIFEGNDHLEPSHEIGEFDVYKYDGFAIINANNATYGSVKLINITVPEDAEGTVNVTVNGTEFDYEYILEINNGTVLIPLSNFNIDVYNITVRFEDDKYNFTSNSTLFSVTKLNPTINIAVDNVAYGNDTVIAVNVLNVNGGNVTLKINDTLVIFENETLVGGTTTFIVKNLPADNYTINVTYTGDEIYNNASAQANFTVNRCDPAIDITVRNISYGEVEHIEIRVNAGGEICVRVAGNETNMTLEDGQTVTVHILRAAVNEDRALETFDGRAEEYVYGLAVGTYPVEVIYKGNNNFNMASKTAEFTVSKINTTLDVDYDRRIIVWNNESVNVTILDAEGNVIENATGNVTVSIDGFNYTASIKNSVARFNITHLSAGNKVAWIFYDGDKNLTGNRTMIQFNVAQRTPDINVTADNITTLTAGKITVNVPSNATGYVIVSGNFTRYSIYINQFNNGKAEIPIANLANGTYSVHIRYYGEASDNYTIAENDTVFKVSKANMEDIAVSVENIVYGRAANITVTVAPDATGYVTIRINETRNITLPISNGKVNWIVEGLAADNYTVYANYSGDGKYTINNADKDFNVTKPTPTITIDVVEVDANANATVVVHINSQATGRINITVNNKNYSSEIDNGVARIVIDKLNKGNYTVVANYTGDKNFTKALTSQDNSVNVYKYSGYDMNVTALDVKVGVNTTITVKVPADATGNVSIYVNGTFVGNASIATGAATLELNKTISGKYVVNATFGDDKYVDKTATTNFYVSKWNSPIEITIGDNIKVGDNVTVTVTLPEDIKNEIVTLEINGKTLTNTSATNVVTFIVPSVTYGNKTVTLTYGGNNKYVSNSTTDKFEVTKRTPELDVVAVGNAVGSSATITVNVPVNATGYVTVNVNGTNYTINLTAGHGSVEIAGIGNGTYYVHATYLGDDQYTAAVNNTETFVIFKLDTEMAIAVDDIDYGAKANITVTITNDATGFITIRINETRNITLPIGNGKVNWIVDGLAADNYTVYANYSGDGKYNINSTDDVNRSFEVRRISPDISIVHVGSVAGENATIIVTIDSRATQTITVNVDKDYVKSIGNGLIIVTTDKLENGTYTITASYLGDANFTEQTVTRTFTTNKTSDYVLNITTGDIEIGDLTDITVNVPGDAKGIVIVEIEGVNYTAVIEDGKAVFNNQTNLGAGRYNVTAYFGNNKYENKTATGVFTINKLETPIEINVDPIKVGDQAIITITVPEGLTENVTVEIDGVKYNKSVTGTTAVFNVPINSNGTRTVVATYPGDDSYVANSTTAKFDVTKRSLHVNVTVVSPVNVGDNTKITVKVPANATGYAIVNVDGINHTVNLTAGEGSVEIAGLKNQTYKVTVTYIGDDQYLSRINDTQEIKVNKVASTINITVSDDGIIDNGSDVNITMKLPSDATGKVNVTLLNGTEIIKSYIVFVNEGNSFLHLDSPAIGLYNVTAEYLGDDKYLGSKNNTEFDVYRTGKELSVFTHDVAVNVNGTIEVALGGRHEGSVLIIVSNVTGEIITENAPVNTGDAISTADFTLPLLDAGDYHVRAVYIESDGDKTIIHDGTGTFKVHKLSSHITIDKLNDTIFVGEKETIKLAIDLDSRANDGNISVFVNGVEYNTTTSDLTVEIADLNAGDYEVKVIFHGNDWYYESNASAAFKVIKNPALMDVKVTNSTGGSVEQINVTFLDDVSGQVLLDIGGQHYYANITGGIAQFNITGLEAKEHEFNVTYLGDNKYLANNTSSTLKISKIQPSLTIDVENKTVGESEKIIVRLPDNATGYVVIDVDGTKYHVDIVKGQETALTISNLKNKTYDVKVTYSGDDYYENATSSDKFNVSKIKSEITVKVEDVAVGDVAVVNITVSDGATGNVTVTIGNEFNRTIGIVGGIISIAVPDLTVGDKAVDVTYNGDDKYLPNINSTTFSVGKLNITSNTEIIDNGNGTVTVIVPENATGNVTIYVDGKNFTGNISNGMSVITLNNVTPGKHDISVVYSGDENHANATAKSSVTIPKLDSPISVSVTDIKVGDTALINVSAPTGDVTVEINGKTYNPVSFENGIAKFIVENLSHGNKTVAVTYLGNSNYTGNFTTANFTVSKRNSSVKVNVEDIIVRDIACINVTVPNNATGIVTVSVGENNFTVNVTDGHGTIQVKGLGNGTYNVIATYMGDDQYLSSVNDTESFNVDKVASDIGITISHEGIVPNGTDVDITITAPGDATGKVEVVISNGLENVTYTVYVHDGIGQLHLETPEIAIYNVTAKYLGDDKYLGCENISEFDVYPTGKALAVDTEPVFVSDQENILIYVSGNHVGKGVMIIVKDAQGNIVKEENATFSSYFESPFNGSSARFKLDPLPAGDYDVEAIYLEKDGLKTIEHTGIGHFKVSKLNSTLSIKEIRNVTFGENVTIELEIGPAQATGNISVFVNGVEYITNTSALTITIPNPAAEEYIVHALYYGNHDFNASNASSAFKVSKLSPEITVNATSIDVGDKVLIEITAPKDIKLPLLVDVGGVGYYVRMADGKGSLYVPSLESGDYNVTVIYLGDDKYLEAQNTTGFKVSKVTSSVNVTVENITVGENAIINIETPNDLCGNVTVTVDEINYTVPVSGGKGILVISDLNVGNYTVEVNFDGCEKYEPSNATAKFNVAKLKTGENDIKLIDQGNGTLIVIVPDNATGNVTVKVDGKEYNATVINGTAIVNLDDNVTPGTHDVEIIYSGDDTHNASSINKTITAPKYDAPISIDVGGAVEGEPVIITVGVPDDATGNVTVSVDGKDYTAEVENGVAIITVPKLTDGDKTIAVKYDGDDNYVANSTVGNFTVVKALIEPDMKVIDQGNGTIAVVVGDNATGNVTVKVGGKEYNATVINGTAIVNLDNNVTPGTHDVEIIYSGDDTHNASSINKTITAPRYETPIEIEMGESKEGEPVIITVSVPDDAVGDVIVSVGGKNYTAPIIGGKATVAVDDLSAGDHTIAAEFAGDSNYVANYTIGNLTVEKALIEPDMKVIDQGNGTIAVVVGDNASGNVTVKVDGKEYTVPVENGTAVVNLDNNVTPGDHEVEIIYSGDDTHNASSINKTITAPKYDAPITINVGDAKEGEPVIITVSVPDDATGNVTVSVDGNDYTAEVENGVATITIPELTDGDKTVVVKYDGDDNYVTNLTVGNFTVVKALIEPDMKVIDQGNGTIAVVVGDNASGNVTVKVDGKEYTVPVENGTAVVNLDNNVAPGTHEVEITYSGDDTHNASTVTANITGPIADTPLDISVDNIKVGDKQTIAVTVPEGATGDISIEIDGETYTQPIKDGKATFTVGDLTAGKKSVFVKYDGDGKYNANSTTVQFNVTKRDATINATIEDIEVGENLKVTVTLPEDATGQVLIDIDGVGYYVNVTNGTGSCEISHIGNGTYEVTLTYTGDDQYGSSSTTKSFKVEKIESFVIPIASNIYVGENENIKLLVPSDATGNVTVIIDGEEFNFNFDDGILSASYGGAKYTVAISGGNGELVISGLPKGEYYVSVRYNGDEKYLPATNSTIFTVSKIDTPVNVEDLGNGTIKITVPEDATGNVTIKVGNETYAAKVENGTATITLDKTTPGKHDVEVTYSGDNDYASKTVKSTVDVPKHEAPIDASADNIKAGQDAVITVNVPDGATGKVTVEIDGKTYTGEIKDGKAQIIIPDLTSGNKTAVLKYDGDDNYLGNSTYVQFTISKVEPTIKATPKDVSAGKDEVITVTVPNDATGQVLVEIKGVGYYGDIVNGKAKVIIPKLDAGKYTAKITYIGDDKYAPVSTTATFTVKKAGSGLSAISDEINIGDDATVTIKLPKDATGTVTISVGGKKYTTKVYDGKAVFMIPGLSAGIYSAVVHYSGDAKYNASTTVTAITVHDAGHYNHTHKGSSHSVSLDSEGGVNLSAYATGNPIWVLLLLLLTVVSTQMRRFRK